MPKHSTHFGKPVAPAAIIAPPLWLAVLTAMLLTTAIAQAQQPSPTFRSQLPLDGTWQLATTKDKADAPPTAADWRDTNVPGVNWAAPEAGSPFLWYRRDVQIPADWAGRRIFANLRGAKYAPRLYVDGRFAGGQLDGWTPLEVEITSLVTPAQTHRLELRCQDRSATFPEGFVAPPNASPDKLRGKVLAPVGGHQNFVGPWLPIRLEAQPQQRLLERELVITPSTRKGTLTLSGKADGKVQDLWVQATVLDGTTEVLRLDPTKVDANHAWAASAPFPNAHHWSPEDPHLYILRLTLRQDENGPVLDVLEKRWGFKEIWTEGPDFYLNGVKRHLLASSTWPIVGYESADAIRKKIQAIKEDNVIAFRLHTQPWQEEWLDISDELGLLIVEEAAVYTDGDGFYGYQDDRFWQNYRDHVAGMIARDRNHASLIMWSMGNEILFMGNQRYERNLPKKLGDLGRFAKAMDPQHPITFEADLDPDGAYDVLGLHYPHELPDQHAYPNVCDWLSQEKLTEAGGGMLGQQRSHFFWDRKKPLYIGEYLWIPLGDYSPGSVFFGEDAYLNRQAYMDRARLAAWNDQTLAYRRAGVSGLCPWSAFDSGGGMGSPEAYAVQQRFYRPVAAFGRNRDLRLFAGDSAELTFDVFNDSAKPLELRLKLVRTGEAGDVASQTLKLEPAGYQPVTLKFTAPDVSSATEIKLDSVLLAAGQEAHRETHVLRAEPGTALQAPAGKRLLAYDPTGTWPQSLTSLDTLKDADPAATVLLIAPGALSAVADGGTADPAAPQQKDAPPVIGRKGFDRGAFLAFLKHGGRAVVLEQQTLSPLGLDLSLVDHASTMSFPLATSHPLLAGIAPDDLKFWGKGHYVARQQIRRPQAGGAAAVVVSGGPRSLDQASVVQMPVGPGHVVLIQALVGEKRQDEPAAARLLQNAVNYLAALPAASEAAAPAVVLSEDEAFLTKLTALNLSFRRQAGPLAESDLKAASGLVLHGGGPAILGSAPAIARFVQSGGALYWHCPDTQAFDALRTSLGADGLRIEVQSGGTTMRLREHPLLRGISREDLTYTTRPEGWERNLALEPQASAVRFLPAAPGTGTAIQIAPTDWQLEGARLVDNSAKFDRLGTLRVTADIPQAGLYPLSITASGTAESDRYPLLRIDINQVTSTWFDLAATQSRQYTTLLDLPAGKSQIDVAFTNGSRWGGGRQLTVEALQLGPRVQYPAGSDMLAMPGTLVALRPGQGKVVLDGIRWADANDANSTRAMRYASALLANLGLPFTAPPDGQAFEPLPLTAFRLIGESPYYDAKPQELTMRSAAVVEADFTCAADGRYAIRLDGYSTPVHKEYAKVQVLLDDKELATAEIASASTRAFEVAQADLAKGAHKLRLAFINDQYADGEDRNLFLQGVLMQKR